jgi:hypothetical protein
MACTSCESENRAEFGAEINIHFPGRRGVDMPPVLVFPKLMVCLNCGFAEFTVAETDLRLLREGLAALAA